MLRFLMIVYSTLMMGMALCSAKDLVLHIPVPFTNSEEEENAKVYKTCFQIFDHLMGDLQSARQKLSQCESQGFPMDRNFKCESVDSEWEGTAWAQCSTLQMEICQIQNKLDQHVEECRFKEQERERMKQEEVAKAEAEERESGILNTFEKAKLYYEKYKKFQGLLEDPKSLVSSLSGESNTVPAAPSSEEPVVQQSPPALPSAPSAVIPVEPGWQGFSKYMSENYGPLQSSAQTKLNDYVMVLKEFTAQNLDRLNRSKQKFMESLPVEMAEKIKGSLSRDSTYQCRQMCAANAEKIKSVCTKPGADKDLCSQVKPYDAIACAARCLSFNQFE